MARDTPAGPPMSRSTREQLAVAAGAAGATAATLSGGAGVGVGGAGAIGIGAGVGVGGSMNAYHAAAEQAAAAAAAAAVTLHGNALQQKILELQQQHQLQQQILRQQYQAQERQLAEMHEQQMHQLKLWEQKQLEERREKERLEALKKKDKHDHSAVASTEVKQRLQSFLVNKKQREAAAAANGAVPGTPAYRTWLQSQSETTGSTSGSHPYRMPQILQEKFGDDFPLRKTASEPNLLKVRLKQRVMERNMAATRNSPLMARRKDRLLSHLKRKSLLANTSSNPESGPNSPPTVGNSQPSPTAAGSSVGGGGVGGAAGAAPTATQPAGAGGGGGSSTPIQEEGESAPYGGQLSGGSQQGSLSDLSLFSSPSMPNISLGRPHVPSSSTAGTKLAPVSEAEVRAAFTARFGMPLTGTMLRDTLPFYPSLTVIDGGDPAYIHKQMQSLEQQQQQQSAVAAGGASAVAHQVGRTNNHHHHHPTSAAQQQHQQQQQQQQPHQQLIYHPTPITDTQVAHARLHKAGHRPLGRTQSAPLPLGHPMLQGGMMPPPTTTTTHYEEYLAEKQLHDQQQQTHNYLKQQIRQTVLTRVGSRGQPGGQQQQQLDEAPESEESEVIDLTGKKDNPVTSGAVGSNGNGANSVSEESEISKQQRDREQFLQQQRDLMMRHTLQAATSDVAAYPVGGRSAQSARPLSRALSSPLVHLGPQGNPTPAEVYTRSTRDHPTTGLAYDPLMQKHACTCGETVRGHPEHGGRLQSVWARFVETGLSHRCDRVRSRKATLEEIQTCHTEAHTYLFGGNPMTRQKLDMSKVSFIELECGGIGVDSDTTWNQVHTAPAARLAAGCVIELAFKVAIGGIRNGFAVVRPPGHHAEANQAMGFCFFNSVAIATKLLFQKFDLRRILIVDWDVHHGNGTQQMFYDDPRVLYLSIHRHDDGNFFPGTGGPTECGIAEGLGYNVNLAWSGGLNPPMGDAEYLAAFRTVVMPIAKEFEPDLVLVSAGFDAAVGHPAPLGGYKVSPACFGRMTQMLMTLAGGKVALVLEGGYDLPAICDSAQECLKALLGDELTPIRDEELTRSPCQNAIDTLQKTIAIQMSHWPCVKLLAHTVGMSAIEASQKEHDETETVSAMASLSMQHQSNLTSTPEHSREVSEEPMEQDEAK